MLHALLYSLKDNFIIFNLLKYITFRSLAAFFTAFIVGVIIAPFFIRKMREFGAGQAIRKDGPESHHVKSGTPTMGGIFMLAAALIAIALWSIFNWYVMVVTLSIILFGAIGFMDDFLKVKYKDSRGVAGKMKIIFQGLFSLILIGMLFINPDRPQNFWSFYIPLADFPVWVWPPLLAVPFFVFTMISFSNATNLSDGLDGLAAGMGVFLYIPFGIIAYVIGNAITADYLKFPFIPGTGELCVIIAAMIGGFAAFLWYNVHPAQVFMGDTGSLSMGGAIATIAIILKHEILLIVAGGMFVIETLSVVMQRSWFKYTKKKYGEGRRIFLMAPIHHHFEKKGWKETQVVVRFWILSALFALLALATLKVR